MSQRDVTNYYEILEIPSDAHASEVQKAYQRAKQTYSQENPALYSMFSAEEARELMRLIDEAFAVLNNATSRKSYDESLLASGGPPVARPSMSASVPPPTRVNTESAAPSPPRNAASVTPTASEGVTIRPQVGKSLTPPGTGRTSLSNYKIDEALESEIAQATEFDGAFLQRIRLYKNISLEKMSDATRISRTYLSAVEANDYKSLPASVFVRGFVVQIARQLGLEDQKVASSYVKAFKAGGGK